MTEASKVRGLPDTLEILRGDVDALWVRLRAEAIDALARAPMLAGLFVGSILDQTTFETAVFHRIAGRLKNDQVPQGLLTETFGRALAHDSTIGTALRADIAAVLDRDPACERLIEPFLYFKGFHAVQTHRLAHWLWRRGERDFALYLQSRSSDVFQTDIHPAARFGRGIFLDHATGLVVGETAQVDDNVSLLQNVTLGGTGKDSGDRHPKVRHGVMIGAGAKILGNIEIGANSRIAAGSVVLREVEPNATVAGIPAKVIRSNLSVDTRPPGEILGALAYESFDYSI
ncbi:serine O-acetyltransferase [Magnetospirillum molischianum]|uniref:Serine acetyltransferase n=1 Tax=Magnetospirillum molischianum DSM 120 TaxID=1150626 RepID=H8FRX8_MAGML|nr:serine O-acetyltransferase [Magnetospirillum molischianum]CCG41116.1 serine acetyltransferase [Magnetospirillum molischianum DSM 120]